MKAAAALLLIAAAPAPAVPPQPLAASAPRRVLSINVCADQLLLALLPPARIAGVTWLARDPAMSQQWRAAARVPAGTGTAEEVLRAKPDLVIAGRWTTPATRALLRRLGLPLLEIGDADDFPAIRAQVRQVAAAVGERARGEALVARLDAGVARLAAAPRAGVRVAAWDAAGFAARRGSLFDTLLGAAGADNVAAERAGDIETLVALHPALLIRGGSADTPRGDGDHPLLRRLWQGRTVMLPASATMCGTADSAAWALALRARLAGVP